MNMNPFYPYPQRPAAAILITFFLLFPLLTLVLPATAAVVEIDDLVVTATRSQASGFDLPTSVELVNQEQLQRQSPPTVGQPLAELSGVSLARDGYWEISPVIRGLGGNRVLVLIDGDRESNLWAGRAPMTPFLDAFDVSRIEVVKGPASVLYGSDALGGVVNILTSRPVYADADQWSLGGRLGGRYSSVDEGFSGGATLSGGGHGFDFGLTVSARDADSFKDGGGDEVANSQYEGAALNFKGRYCFTENQDLSLAVRSNRIDDLGVPQKALAAYSHFTRFDTDSFKLAWHGRDIGGIDDIELRSFYVDQTRDFAGNIHSDSQPMFTLKENTIDSAALGASLQMKFALGDRHQLVAGSEVVHEKCEGEESQIKKKDGSNLIAKVLRFEPVPDADRDHLGVYLQDEFFLRPDLSLFCGLRYDYFTADAKDSTFTTDAYNATGAAIKKTTSETSKFKAVSDDALTFNLGLLYAVNEQIHLTANLASGFRAPDIFEFFSTRGGSYIILGDPELDPEYSWNAEVGCKLNYRRLRLTAAAYYTRVHDYIDLVNNGKLFAGLEAHEYVNVDDAELYGADGSLEIDLTGKICLFGNLAWVVGRDRKRHERLNDIPPLNGIAGLRWQDRMVCGYDCWLECSGNFFDCQDDPAPGELETPGYAFFNLRSGIKFDQGALKDIALTLNVENLFDKKYRDHLNAADFYNDPGLNVIAGLEFSF
ncbi:MAG: TonB-dependent receptor [Deltaproteobacteria bacterium]|nr:TonB-dependent receptor [Deltaproteobacteria bacterium]